MNEQFAFSRVFSFGRTFILGSFFLLACDGRESELDPQRQSADPLSGSAQDSEAGSTLSVADAPALDASEGASSDHGTRLSGICIVRGESTNLPAKLAPDIGPGYAKLVLPGFHDIAGLKVACTDAIFQTLLSKHCATGSNRVQAQIATYTPDGKWHSTTCGAIGCNFLYCPASSPVSGACIVREDGTNMPPASAPNRGAGYAKQPVPGVSDLAGLKAACTSSIFQTLLRAHCATQTAPVQAQLVTYDSDGSPHSTTCGAVGCDFMTCR